MPTDRREYIRLDVAYFDNPKIYEVLEESPTAVILHIASMAMSRQHRTDGILKVRQALRKVSGSESDAEILLRLGLWHDIGDGKVEVHDYDKHQETRDQIEARSAAAQKANRVRWNSNQIPIGSEPDSEPDSGTPPIGNPEERRGEERRAKAAGTRASTPRTRPTLDVAGALNDAGLPPNEHENFLQSLRDHNIKRPPGYVMRAHHDGALKARIDEWRDEVTREAKTPRVIAPNVTATKRGPDGKPVTKLCEHDFEEGRCPTCRRKGAS